MNEADQTKYQEETDRIERELQYWMSKPRNSYTEKKVKKLIAKAGYPVTAKSIGRQKKPSR